jgi:hypothetical protein
MYKTFLDESFFKVIYFFKQLNILCCMCIKLNEIIQKYFKLLCQVILKLYEIQISMDKISIVSYRFVAIR